MFGQPEEVLLPDGVLVPTEAASSLAEHIAAPGETARGTEQRVVAGDVAGAAGPGRAGANLLTPEVSYDKCIFVFSIWAFY